MTSHKQKKQIVQYHLELDFELDDALRAFARAARKPIASVVRNALQLYLDGRGRRLTEAPVLETLAGDLARTMHISTCAVHYTRQARDQVMSHGDSRVPPIALLEFAQKVDRLILEISASRRQLALHLGDLSPARPIPRTRNRDLPRDKPEADEKPMPPI